MVIVQGRQRNVPKKRNARAELCLLPKPVRPRRQRERQKSNRFR